MKSLTDAPIFFTNSSEFRAWLEENHLKAKELWVGYYRVETGRPSMTWSESVDQALCFGWIDGIRKKVDDEGYCIRFTPRKKTSTWSRINIDKVEELKKKGLMRPAGLEAYSHKKDNNSGIYSFENEVKDLPEEYVLSFQKDKTAWEFYSAQPPSYRKVTTHWILSAKLEKTRQNRLEKLMAESRRQRRITG